MLHTQALDCVGHARVRKQHADVACVVDVFASDLRLDFF